ncbi:lectin like domain-containing protein [Methanobrevibacter sp.]
MKYGKYLILILLVLILSMNNVCAQDSLNDTINELSISDYDLICDDGDEDQFTDDVDDLQDDDYELDEETYFYEEIQSNDSDMYCSFVKHLTKECNFTLDLNNSDFENDGYCLITPNNYSFKLYSGETYNLNPGDSYLAVMNGREGTYISGIYYPDIIYLYNGNKYLDEDFLGWLAWEKQFKCNSINLEEIINNSKNIKHAPAKYISNNNLPDYYNLADNNLVSTFKKQRYGDCWAFASIASLESHLLKTENKECNFGVDLTDFSENHLKNLISSRGINGSGIFEGGYLSGAASYFLRWSGPIDENSDKYGVTNYSYEYFNPLKHVQDILFISARSYYNDNTKIKEAIINYGAVATNMYFNNSYIRQCLLENGKISKFYYYASDRITNNTLVSQGAHSVTIIGWDDNCDKNMFNAQHNGAFIVKDSNFNYYYYVSYDDLYFARLYVNNHIASMAFVNVENVTNYKSIYQYDTVFNYDEERYSSVSNIFTASSDDEIQSIGFYNLGTNLNVKVEIFVNDNIKYAKYFTSLIFGYNTIRLTELVNIKQGDTFEVKLTFDSNCRIAADSLIPSKHHSYYYKDNQRSLYNYTFCIKAYTCLNSNVKVAYFDCKDINSEYGDKCFAGYLKSKGNPISNVPIQMILIDRNNNSKVLASYNNIQTDNNGGIYLPSNILPINCRAVLNFKGNHNYYSCSKAIDFIITKATTSISLNSKCYYSESLILTLKHSNKFLSNKKITITINGKDYIRTTDKNGKIDLPIFLANNKYTFQIKFNGDANYSSTKKSLKFTVMKPTAKFSLSSYSSPFNSGKQLTVKVTNKKNNNAIKNVIFSLKIYNNKKSKTYNVKSDSNGVAKFSISKIGIGSYNAFVASQDKYVAYKKVKTTVKVSKASTILSAPKVSNKLKSNSYFKVTLKHKTTNKLLSGVQIVLKIYTGSSYKSFTIKTESNGVASFKTNSLIVGTHKVVINSGNKNYAISGTSSITIKK